MPAGVSDANENLGKLNSTLNIVNDNVNSLGNSLRSLANVLPLKEVRNIEDSYSKLNRTLTLTSKEVDVLKTRMTDLSKTTEYYSREVLVAMNAKFAQSTSAIALFTNQHAKLTEIFTKTYRQDAPLYLEKFKQLAEQMPILTTRFNNASTSATTFMEVLQRGGREGLAAYLTAIEKVNAETKRLPETTSDALKKLETSFDNFKTKLGFGAGGAVTSTLGFAAANPILAYGGMKLASKIPFGAAASYASEHLGLGPSIGPGDIGLNKLIMRGGFRGAIGKGLMDHSTSMAFGGAAAYGAGQIGQDYFGETGGIGLIGSRLASTAGAFTTGAALGSKFGGTPGAMIGGGVAALGEVGRQVYSYFNGKNRIAEEGRQTGEDTKNYVHERGEFLKYGGSEALSLMASVKDKEGTTEESEAQIKAFLALSRGSTARSLGGGLSDEERHKHEADAELQMANARAATNSLQLRAGVPFSIAQAQAQSAMELNPLGVNGGAVRSALQGKIGAAQTSLATYEGRNDDEAVARRAEIEAQLIGYKKEEARYAVLEQEGQDKASKLVLGIAGAEKSVLQTRGASYAELNKMTDIEIKENMELSKRLHDEARILELKHDYVGAQEKAAEAARAEATANQLRLEITHRENQLLDNRVAIQKQLLNTSSFGSPLTQGRAASLDAENIFAKLQKGGLSSDERIQLEQQLKSSMLEAKFASTVSLPLYQAQTKIQGFEAHMGAMGGMGKTGETQLAQMRIAAIEQEIDLKSKFSGKDRDNDGIERLKIEQDKLQVLVDQNNEYGKQREVLNFNTAMIDKQLAMAKLARNPFVASQLYQKDISANQAILQNMMQELTSLRNRGADPEIIRQKELAVEQKKVDIASKYDFQRRTFGEMFTQQVLNMPSGSYLMPSEVSNYSTMGSSYFSGISQYGGKKGTYESQISNIFGEGVNTRSNFETFFERLTGDGFKLTGELTVKDGKADLRDAQIQQAATGQ